MRAIEAFVTGSETAAPPEEALDRSPLSARERELLTLVAAGLTDREIAAQLIISEHTAHRHIANIRRKLGQSTRAAAAAEAELWRQVPPGDICRIFYRGAEI